MTQEPAESQKVIFYITGRVVGHALDAYFNAVCKIFWLNLDNLITDDPIETASHFICKDCLKM